MDLARGAVMNDARDRGAAWQKVIHDTSWTKSTTPRFDDPLLA